MNNGTILRGAGLSKRYGDLEVVKGVSLTIDNGEFVCLTGKSGSGKTTLLSILSGLERPTSGHVKLDGKDITGSTEDELARFQRERRFHLPILQPDPDPLCLGECSPAALPHENER